MTRYEHRGNARKAKFAADASSSELTITGDDLTGWPDGSIGLFWGVANRDTPAEEKILFSSRSNNTLTVFSDAGGNGRGKDDTTAQAHKVGDTLEHVWTATEADQANAHVDLTDGAHGYPNKADLVTLTGGQTVHDKTMVGMIAHSPSIDDIAVLGGTLADLTEVASAKVHLSGAQAPAEFRVRDIMLSTADPTPADGEDGDVWLKYV